MDSRRYTGVLNATTRSMSILRLRSLVVFAAALGASLALPSSAHAGGDGRLLIIYDGTFYEQVEDFMDWKLANDPGLDGIEMVDVGKTGVAPIDANDIDAFIESYAARHSDLGYVLLVGDENTVPPTWEPDATDPSTLIASDYTYANLDADDEPELAVGRIIPRGAPIPGPVFGGGIDRKLNLAKQFAKIEAQHQLSTTSPVYSRILGAADYIDDIIDAKATVGNLMIKATGTTTAGAAGNAYRVRYQQAMEPGLTVFTDAAAKTIQVNLGLFPFSMFTAEDVAAAINADATASAWVTATAIAGQETVVQTETRAWVHLTGGEDADGAPSTSLFESIENSLLSLEDNQGATVTRAYNATSVDDAGNLLPGGVAPTYIDARSSVLLTAVNSALAYTPGGSVWSAGPTQVSAAFAAGVETVVYMGHGSPHGWASPHFDLSDANALTNTYYPVVFNFACSTGDYAGKDSLAEALLQNPTGGASAVFSATTLSSSGGIQLEDYITGLLESIDRDSDTSVASQKLHRIGDRVVYLKKFIIANYDSPNHNNLHDHLHQFTLFGDPTMRYRPFK